MATTQQLSKSRAWRTKHLPWVAVDIRVVRPIDGSLVSFINGPGWAPSMVIDANGIRSGADAAF